MCLPVMLCHPKIAELCKLHAAAPECGEYLLMVRMIPKSQQVSSPVTTNKGKHGCLLVQKCLCHYVHCILRMITTAHEDVENLQSCRKDVFIYYMYYWSGPSTLHLSLPVFWGCFLSHFHWLYRVITYT